MIYSYGESLIRYDISPNNELKIFPTGTSLNFLSNLNHLDIKNLHIITGISFQKDNQIFISKFDNENINYEYSFFSDYPMGSYQIYRLQELKNWDVVYNRSSSSWQMHIEDIITPLLNNDDYFHFDGISLLVSENSQKRTLSLFEKITQKTNNIIFDFNYRKKIIDKNKNYINIFKNIFTKIRYLNISKYDFMEHFGIDNNFRDSLEKFSKEYPNIEYIFGTWKENKDDGMQVNGFEFNSNILNTVNNIEYKPIDLIGQGDAFFAHVMSEIIRNKKPNINEAILWSIFKLSLLGDSSIPAKKEFLNFRKNRS